MNKIKWTLKQLLPLRYQTTYGDVRENKTIPKIAFWKMWFGRCFDIHEYELADGQI